MRDFYQFLSGMVAMGSFVAGLFFLRFRRHTQDRLFGVFAVAFFTLSIERVVLAFMGDATGEERSYVYLIRLLAFTLILIGIVDKNLAEKRSAR